MLLVGAARLAGVHDEQAALACGQRAADLVAKVDVPGGVDQVERVHVPVGRGVPHASLVELDGDAPLALQVHPIQELRLAARLQAKQALAAGAQLPQATSSALSAWPVLVKGFGAALAGAAALVKPSRQHPRGLSATAEA